MAITKLFDKQLKRRVTQDLQQRETDRQNTPESPCVSARWQSHLTDNLHRFNSRRSEYLVVGQILAVSYLQFGSAICGSLATRTQLLGEVPDGSKHYPEFAASD
jgi:hypothetical protein